jgi:Protein of unknown function, DUF599
MKTTLIDWLASLHNRPGGDILAVQTLRNSLMAASVLASAALVGLMGVLATAHLHARWSSASAATLLVASAICSVRALWTLSAAGFDLRLGSGPHMGNGVNVDNAAETSTNTVASQASNALVQEMAMALRSIRWSGVLLILALAAAAASVWLGK